MPVCVVASMSHRVWCGGIVQQQLVFTCVDKLSLSQSVVCFVATSSDAGCLLESCS